MSTPFRDTPFRCPDCPDAPLRPYGRRLVCDACGGMQMPIGELEDHLGTTATVVDTSESTEACPRCQKAMRGFRLQMGEVRYDKPLLRCARGHGVWFASQGLAGVLEAFGRHFSRGVGPYYGDGGDDAELLLGYRRRKLRLRATPAPTSAYADRRLACPVCTGHALRLQGDRWTCDECAGVFVEHPALEAMVTEMTQQPWQPPPVSGEAGDRACPICATAMISEAMVEVAIDRCVEHGVWFDPSELGAVLERSAEPPRGLAGWLRRLVD